MLRGLVGLLAAAGGDRGDDVCQVMGFVAAGSWFGEGYYLRDLPFGTLYRFDGKSVYHQRDGNWQVLETTVVDTAITSIEPTYGYELVDATNTDGDAYDESTIRIDRVSLKYRRSWGQDSSSGKCTIVDGPAI